MSGIGAGVIVGNAQDDPVGNSLAIIALGGVGILIGGATFLITNLTSGIKKAEYRNLLLSKIDYSTSYQQARKAHLDLGLTQNGIGLIYSF